MSTIRCRGANALRISTSLRFSVDEYLRLSRSARKAHMSVSDYIRERIGLPANRWSRGLCTPGTLITPADR